ncbi:hypothetical protein FEM03_06100 [Phragmitibacter flavus]|uniref:Peptidase metallopeptidase domain-containing protein n=1 Tax=Phragmitibacter flavus TaxID=2576071 RepID=A0A5R8KHB0_9BACT|nr:M12 family metallopeptidase [Phragmitibacter flavus]TLD71708.1 hypothetical protein FEM03_06100 [Phragmitibacter flavus]
MNANELTEHIIKTARTIQAGNETGYIVENDLVIPASQLQNYARETLALLSNEKRDAATVDRLIVATLNDKKLRWAPGTVLSWTIDEVSFGEHKAWFQTAKTICAQAADDWNRAAKDEGVLDMIRFAPAEPGKKAAFTFAYHPFPSDPNLLALAFFPNAAKKDRIVFIGPGTFALDLLYDRVGIIRHELGHVLGFRHEQIHPKAQEGMTAAEKKRMEKWVSGGLGAEELTEWDSQSVMHYPLNGHGTLQFALSDDDKTGFGKLYRIEKGADKVEECHL